MTVEKHSWSGLCRLNDVLCWERYGYDSECGGPPTWASDLLTQAKEVAKIAQPADCHYEVVITEHGNFGTYNGSRSMGVKGTFRVWDEANPWVEAWEVGFLHYDEASARKHYGEKEFANHKRLHDGVINALLHFAKTGEPTLEAWRPESAWYFKAKKYDSANRAYLRENEPGVPYSESHDGTNILHVEIRAHGPNECVAECFAEGPNQYRRQRGKFFSAPTYAEVRALAEAWVSEVARPFIAHELANPVDYVEVTDVEKGTGKMTTHAGELFGIVTHQHGVYVKLDNPASYPGQVRNGIAWVEWWQVRKVERIERAS